MHWSNLGLGIIINPDMFVLVMVAELKDWRRIVRPPSTCTHQKQKDPECAIEDGSPAVVPRGPGPQWTVEPRKNKIILNLHGIHF